MTTKLKAILTLYKAGKTNKERLKEAVKNKIISADDYFIITGEQYSFLTTDEIISENDVEENTKE